MIHIHRDWLDPEVLQQIMHKYQESQGQAAFELNNHGRWGKGLETGSFAPVVVLPYPELRDYFLSKYQALDPVFQPFEHVEVFMQIWPAGSQINWHHDADDTGQIQRIGSTIYLNEAWNWNWGGLFLYDDPDSGLGWIFPEHNKMIWFVPPLWHSTSMVTLAAEYPRVSLQLFFTRYL